MGGRIRTQEMGIRAYGDRHERWCEEEDIGKRGVRDGGGSESDMDGWMKNTRKRKRKRRRRYPGTWMFKIKTRRGNVMNYGPR